MRRSRLVPALVALALAGSSASLAIAGSASAGGIPTVSENVTLEFTAPEPGMISGAFSPDGRFFYSSGLTELRVYDTSDPLRPLPMGAVAMAVFENEAMSYGEKMVGGVLKRFIFVGNDLIQATGGTTGGGGPRAGRVGGDEVVIFDVTNPAAPVEAKRVTTTTSTHTLQCVTLDCSYAYTAGSGGAFSVLDLRQLGVDNAAVPGMQMGTFPSPSAKGPFAAGHYWDFDSNGVAWHTGGGGASAFDVNDPTAPVLLATTNADGTSDINAGEFDNYNDFILHNSMRPNGDKLGTSSVPSVMNGNVLIVTEEDYTNDGDEIICERSGSIETWFIPTLTGNGLPADAASGSGNITPLDKLNPLAEDVPALAFCSAHWFDYHQDGFLAQGFYQGGLQIIDVRDAENLSSYGFFRAPGATQVWDAYWAPEVAADGTPTGDKTNIVYTADAVQGLQVFTVALPGVDAPPPVVPEVPVVVLLPLLAAGVLGGAVVLRRRQAGITA